MAFSNEWEERYRENTHMSIWPWSDLVSFVMRYAKPEKASYRVLELGCGAGANIPFFTKMGVEYYALEGSDAIVKLLLNKYPELKGKLIVADFSQGIPFEGQFDLIVDRASVTNDTTDAIRDILKNVHEKLIPGGKFIGIDWYSTEHSEFKNGQDTEDPFTRCNFVGGHFDKLGRVHFSDRAHLEDLFSAFELEILEHKTYSRKIPDDGFNMASWNLVARRS